ncbi:MAG TPA: Na+/H+ antiporter [Chthoniobacterales bacterium]|nr:Na+/H+ antiporter [Chthoniobacterales bacterium]
MIGKTELILICLVAVALLALVARKIRVPYPILLTIGGVLLALVPGLPSIQLEPQLVFNLFLPPLLYPAAVYISWRDFRTNLRPILLMATVLVLLTMTASAAVFHCLVGLPLAVGFVFGAIISPPDAVAALAVTQSLRVPRKIIVILEGESLINDATSFISFRFAVAAVMTGAFSLGDASLKFLFAATGGLCVGIAVGWLATQVQKRLDDPPVQTMFSLLTPYLAYFCGEKLQVSGILAVVITGIYYGWRAPRILNSRMRLLALPVWEMVGFILNGVLFILIGLQLPQVIQSLAPGSLFGLVKVAILVLLVITLVRFAWIFGADYMARLSSRKHRRASRVPWQNTFLIAWTGLRGADSLALALAVPFLLPNGQSFPGRDVILLLTSCVIFGTLLLQGLTLAPLARWLGVVDDHVTEREERLARLKANEAALARLEELGSSDNVKSATVDRLRSEYADRIRQLGIAGSDEESISRLFSPDFEALAREVLQTERNTVIALRNEEAINDQAFRRIQRDIDLAEARLQRPA